MVDRVTRVKCDVAGLTRKIEQVGERAVKGISRVMRGYSELILADTKSNAPRDTGALENAIDIRYARDGVNRRLTISIFVNPNVPYIGKNMRSNPTRKKVGDYAWIMERYLRPHGAGGYKAREGTKRKGPQAGGHFLARAVKRYRMTLIKRAREMARRSTG